MKHSLFSGTVQNTRPSASGRGGFRLRRRSHRKGGPSPAECLIPQMQEQERRKRYLDRNAWTSAPSKLIGYVSAGSIEIPGTQPAPRRKPRGRAIVWGIAVVLAAIWLAFAGA